MQPSIGIDAYSTLQHFVDVCRTGLTFSDGSFAHVNDKCAPCSEGQESACALPEVGNCDFALPAVRSNPRCQPSPDAAAKKFRGHFQTRTREKSTGNAQQYTLSPGFAGGEGREVGHVTGRSDPKLQQLL